MNGSDTVFLLDVLLVVRKRIMLIGFGTALAACIAVGLSVVSILLPPEKSFLPDKYTPKAQVLLKSPVSSGSTGSLSSLAGIASIAGISLPSAGASSAGLITALAEGETFQDTLIEEFGFMDRFHIAKDSRFPKTMSRLMLKTNLNVTFEDKAEILTLSFADSDPEFATKVTNRAVELLQTRYEVLIGASVMSSLGTLNDGLKAAEISWEKAQRDLNDFQVKYDIIDITATNTEVLTLIAEMNGRLVEKELALKSLQSYRSSEDPLVVRAAEEVSQIRKTIDSLKTGSGGGRGTTIAANRLPELGAQFLRLKAEANIQSGIVASLRQQYETTRINNIANVPRFTVMEKANVPEMKSGPKRGKLCAFATAGAFFMMIVIGFLLEYIEKIKADPVEKLKLEALSIKKRALESK